MLTEESTERFETVSEFISVKELASKIGMSVKFVQKHCRTGRLVGMRRIGGRVKFDLKMVEKQMLKEDFLLPSPSHISVRGRFNNLYSNKCVGATKGVKIHGSIT